ncbi:MAG: DNA repair protein, partial [Pseudolabrys sp.]|nr:DNA repair protein [Pseudolabrys sp.]
ARHVAWIAKDMTLHESGALSGAGLDEMARAPERLLTIHPRKTLDLLWAMEEALHCRALGVVIGELRNEDIDLVALRRLSLAAAAHHAIAIVLRASPVRTASAAVTRWIVGSAPSQPRYGPGEARLRAQLIRNRRGPVGDWTLEWSASDERFVLAATNPQPVARPARDRSARAAVA